MIEAQQPQGLAYRLSMVRDTRYRGIGEPHGLILLMADVAPRTMKGELNDILPCVVCVDQPASPEAGAAYGRNGAPTTSPARRRGASKKPPASRFRRCGLPRYCRDTVDGGRRCGRQPGGRVGVETWLASELATGTEEPAPVPDAGRKLILRDPAPIADAGTGSRLPVPPIEPEEVQSRPPARQW